MRPHRSHSHLVPTAGVALAVALALAVAPSRAAAQAPTADQLIEHGVQLREHGQDAEALEEFARAYRLTPTPRARAQMGLAEQALGHWVNAEAYIREALEARTDRWVVTNHRTLERVLPVIGAHLASLEIAGGVPGAAVIVAGQPAGTLPLARPVRVLAGAVELEVRAAGYQTVTRRFDVAPGASARESIEMIPTPATPVATRTEPGPAFGVGGPPRDERSMGGSPLVPLGWVGVVGGAVLLGGGGIALALRNDAAARWNSDACVANGLSRMQNCPDSLSTGQTMEALEIAGFVAGGVFVATGAVLLLVAPRSARAAPRANTTGMLSCAPALGAPGVTCAGTF